MANEQNLRNITSETARDMQLKSAKVRHENAVARKTLASALRQVLDEKVSKDSEMTKLDAITIKAVKRLFEDPRIQDIKVLQEVLGESVTKVDLSSGEEALKIEVSKGETKSALAKILGVK